MNTVWIIEESPNPGIWHVLQRVGMYKSPIRATKAARELQRYHAENLPQDHPRFGWHYRATQYVPGKTA